MKIVVLFTTFFLLTNIDVFGQYVPKEKRETPKDSIKKAPPIVQPKTPREPTEKKFIAYAMAFPTLLQTTNGITINGFNASLNVGYRLHEMFNAGVSTSYGYQNYNNITLGSSSVNGSVRSTGVGAFAQFNFNQSYFAWAEMNNLLTKATDRTAQTVYKTWYVQPLFGVGYRFEFGSGDQGLAIMTLFNPRYGDPYSPYRSIIVSRILYYIHF